MDTKTDAMLSGGAREIVADSSAVGERLDVYLARRMPDMSRSRFQRLIHSGCVEIAGRLAAKSGESIAEGDVIRVHLETPRAQVAAENLPLDILYEDGDLAVLNKSAGMVVHPGAGIYTGTLVNALLYHFQHLSSAGGDERPGIVHRLDKMTSGVMLVAKNDAAHRALAVAFKERAILKTYTALVHGVMRVNEGAVEAPVGRDPTHRYRMKTGGERAREALTRYSVLRRFQDLTLLKVAPRTGRTHQIRVHLASIGHPVVGDTSYGAPARIRIAGVEQKTLPRTFLHASSIELAHPITGKPLAFTAPLPPDLERFLENIAS